jgi:hypothetical protein
MREDRHKKAQAAQTVWKERIDEEFYVATF